MAKNDNLTDYLTDLADGIRAKKGTTEPINSQDFRKEIESISGGGASESSNLLYLSGDMDADLEFYKGLAVLVKFYEGDMGLIFPPNGLTIDKFEAVCIDLSLIVVSPELGTSTLADFIGDEMLERLKSFEITKEQFYSLE